MTVVDTPWALVSPAEKARLRKEARARVRLLPRPVCPCGCGEYPRPGKTFLPGHWNRWVANGRRPTAPRVVVAPVVDRRRRTSSCAEGRHDLCARLLTCECDCHKERHR